MIRKKADIEFHSDGYMTGHPAINVKVYHYPRIYDVQKKWSDISDEIAEKALQYAFESAQRRFWEDIPELARKILGPCDVYSEGRSGGWLVVHGLPDVETWDAIMIAKWRKLEKTVNATIKYLSSVGYVLDDIKVNQWHKEGSELYNFIDYKDGHTACIADLTRDAVAAGFGAGVR